MPAPSRTHLVIIPSFNSGRLLLPTVSEAAAFWSPVWVVIDGSTDGSGEALEQQASSYPNVRVMTLPRNQGKGAAVLHGLRAARAAGFMHALVMDADGQHPADRIPEFMTASCEHPGAMILGRPEFGSDAPVERVYCRKIANFWADLETGWSGIGDSLFGFRVYPVNALAGIMEERRAMRRFDFDAEAVVRLAWMGVQPINIDVPVRYPAREKGGVSHFHYLRDNRLLISMFVRLFFEFMLRRLRGVPATPGESNHSAVD